uniref:Uncharacterized protein n=1 Tax=Ictidomys tridecemlineatus TaxID=43179 RepID=A0A287CW58_ICTTR
VLITSEDPDLASGHGPYSFALGPNPTVQRDWRLQPLNGSHAYLTLALHWVEPREHTVPVIVSHNARMWQLLVRVIVCRCNVEGQCMRKVGRMKGMPTKLSAVGILVGTLAAIGLIHPSWAPQASSSSSSSPTWPWRGRRTWISQQTVCP